MFRLSSNETRPVKTISIALTELLSTASAGSKVARSEAPTRGMRSLCRPEGAGFSGGSSGRGEMDSLEKKEDPNPNTITNNASPISNMGTNDRRAGEGGHMD